MSQQEKNSASAQSVTSIKSEAAIKLFPQNSNKQSENGPTDKDGMGPSDTDISDIHIEIASNGFMVTFTLEDGFQEKSIHTDFDDVLKAIRSRY